MPEFRKNESGTTAAGYGLIAAILALFLILVGPSIVNMAGELFSVFWGTP